MGACINATMLYMLLRLKGFYQPKPGWTAFLLKLAAALKLGNRFVTRR